MCQFSGLEEAIDFLCHLHVYLTESFCVVSFVLIGYIRWYKVFWNGNLFWSCKWCDKVEISDID